MIPEGNRSKGVAYTNDSLESRVRFLFGILVLKKIKKNTSGSNFKAEGLHEN